MTNPNSIKQNKAIFHLKRVYKSFAVNLNKITKQAYPSWIDDIQTHVTSAEKQALYRLASNLPPKSILVEIGSYHGASSACIASAIREPHSLLYCIDTWMNDAVSEERENTLSIFRKNTYLVSSRIKEVRGYSHDVSHLIPEGIDFLFIDGDHSYKGVCRDIELYLPKLKNNAILVMHDYLHDGVMRAIHDHIVKVEKKRLEHFGNFYAARINRDVSG